MTLEREAPGTAGSVLFSESTSRMEYATSGRDADISSLLQMPRLPNSTKQPPEARHDRLASMKSSPVRLFSTTSTPSPPVASRMPSPKAVERLS